MLIPMAPEFEPQEIPATDLAAHAVESIKELRKKRLIQWCIRSAMTGTILWWLSTKFPWVRTVFYIWAVIAVLSLLVLIFLPSIVGNRIRALEQKMSEGMDLGGMAGMPGMPGMPGLGDQPRDVEVDDVSDLPGDGLALPPGDNVVDVVPDVVPVPLEDQLEELETFGIKLSEGITLDDLTHSVERKKLEGTPYQLLVHLLGADVDREPWDRPFSNAIWRFDAECIEGDVGYMTIVESIARIAGKLDLVEGLDASIDFDRSKATLNYTVAGVQRKFRPKVTGNWADPATVQSIVGDLADVDRGFYGIMDGQLTTIVSLSRDDADRFRALLPDEVMELA